MTMMLSLARVASTVKPKGDQASGFPYRDPDVCYLAMVEGEPLQFCRGREEILLALNSLALGEISLYAVWPGKFSSHLFVIDDVEQAAAAFGHTLPASQSEGSGA